MLLQFIIKVFNKNQSLKCETKTVLGSLSKFLIIPANFSIYHVHTGEKMGHHSDFISPIPCKNEYSNYCLHG